MDKVAVVAEEEIELLSSVFCLNGESCRLISKEPCILIQVTISFESSIFSISFELDSRYPCSAPPSISILCQQLSRNASHALANRLRESAQEELLGEKIFLNRFLFQHNKEYCFFIGSPMLLQLCQNAKDELELIFSKTKDNKEDEESCATNTALIAALIELDHVRDRGGYFKHLKQWADELLLNVIVIFLKFRKRKNYWILLQGSEEQVKNFKRNLKTQTVDVDSKGRPCKERMATDIASCPLQIDDILTGSFNLEDIENERDLRLLFSKLKLNNLLESVKLQ